MTRRFVSFTEVLSFERYLLYGLLETFYEFLWKPQHCLSYETRTKPTTTACPPCCCIKFNRSCRFYRKTGDSNGERSLDEIDRDDQGCVIVDGRQDAFYSIETSATNSDALADIQEAMRSEWNSLRKQGSYRVNFAIRDRRAQTVFSHKAPHAGRSQHWNSRSRIGGDSNERVLREQWRFHQTLAITPLPLFAKQREKDAYAFFTKLRGDFFFVPRPSLDREPRIFSFGRSSVQGRACGSLKRVVKSRHSSATVSHRLLGDPKLR